MSDIYGATNDSSGASSPGIGSMLQPPKGLVDDLVKSGREEAAAKSGLESSISKKLDSDAARQEGILNAEGILAKDVGPWDEKAQEEKFHTDPIQAFASVGSVFGIIASAFTHAPMENALNASAAAINAVKSGNDEQYAKAYQAWKDNTALAIKRQEMMHAEYQDAAELMKTNLAAGEAKLKMLTAKYGDKKLQIMAEHGMIEDVYKVMEARAKAASAMARSMADIDAMGQSGLQKNLLDSAFKAIDAQPDAADPANPAAAPNAKYMKDAQKLAAYSAMHNVKNPDEMEAMSLKIAEVLRLDGKITSDVIKKMHQEMQPHYSSLQDAQQQAYQELRQARESGDQEAVKAAEQKMDDIARATSKARAGGTGTPIESREITQEAKDYRDRMQKEHPDWGADKLNDVEAAKRKELRAKSTPAPAGRISQMESQVNRLDYSMDAIDKIEDILKKHNALTGLGGMIRRPEESIQSALGGDETAAHDVQSLIAELKEWAPRLLTDLQGRPMAAETDQLNEIVRGMHFGDTTGVTAKRLYDLKELYARMKADTQKRIGGGTSETTPAQAPTVTTDPLWKKAPLAQ